MSTPVLVQPRCAAPSSVFPKEARDIIIANGKDISTRFHLRKKVKAPFSSGNWLVVFDHHEVFLTGTPGELIFLWSVYPCHPIGEECHRKYEQFKIDPVYFDRCVSFLMRFNSRKALKEFLAPFAD